MTPKTKLIFALCTAAMFFPGAALAQSAVNWNTLRMEGKANPRPWCGQWCFWLSLA